MIIFTSIRGLARLSLSNQLSSSQRDALKALELHQGGKFNKVPLALTKMSCEKGDAIARRVIVYCLNT